MVKKFLKAQALAIIMVVLVVSSIIGVALFSRMSKDRMSAISQQDSTLAQEQADAILDMFSGADIGMLEEVLGESVGPFDRVDDVIEFLLDNNILVVAPTLSGQEWCEGEDKSNIKVSLTQADESDFIEIQPGSVRAYTFDGATITEPSCALNMRFKSVGDSAVFVMKTITDDGVDVSEGDVNYCVTNTEGTTCSGIDDVEYEEVLDKTMIWDDSAKAYYIDPGYIDLIQKLSEDVIEIRILPISGTLAVSNSLNPSDCINKEFRSVKITAEVTCNGSFRGKQMFLPGSGNLGYSTLFDYAIYDSGLFQP